MTDKRPVPPPPVLRTKHAYSPADRSKREARKEAAANGERSNTPRVISDPVIKPITGFRNLRWTVQHNG
jgi:hypothetical protein